MKKKRKLKKSGIILIVSIIVIIVAIICTIKYVNLINSNPYKLEKLGYNEDEIKVITKLDEEKIENILNRDYNKVIVNFLKEKYFIFSNLDEYLEYFKDNSDDEIKHIVALVNVKGNYDPYDEEARKDTDTSKGNLMLVNKFNYLGEYTPDIVSISTKYAYADNEATEEVYDAFKNMFTAAEKENLKILVNSSYRDYKTQQEVWANYEDLRGEEYADSIAAREGFSEHQTGLALDIITPGANKNTFEDTDEFKWLQKNAYKYGFILRYPKGKEDLTGYDYESWHYRYVGKDVAKEIHDKDITYDEYYAYYVNKD